MDEHQLLAERCEEQRPDLKAAYRMLGSLSEAEDAVQEAWLRVSRADGGGIENLRGWPTAIVARVCLNNLKSRGSVMGFTGRRPTRRGPARLQQLDVDVLEDWPAVKAVRVTGMRRLRSPPDPRSR